MRTGRSFPRQAQLCMRGRPNAKAAMRRRMLQPLRRMPKRAKQCAGEEVFKMILSKGLQLVAFCSSYLVLGASALAQEAPTHGRAYNTVEISAIRYDCKVAQGDGLECEFLQTAVRKKQVSQASATDVNFDADDCAGYPEILERLEGKRPPPDENKLDAMTDVMKKDIILMFGAIVRICSNPSEENKLALINLMQDQERRTCIVTANQWHESLKKVSDGIWVTNGVPQGVCGVVQLNRFEREQSAGITFWKYIARKAITNPEAEWEWGSGVKCKDVVDENVYVYDWRSQNHQRSCDYFEFMS